MSLKCAIVIAITSIFKNNADQSIFKLGAKQEYLLSSNVARDPVVKPLKDPMSGDRVRPRMWSLSASGACLRAGSCAQGDSCCRF